LSLLSKHSWRESLLSYRQPRVIGMLFLGFAAGLPFPLVFATLSTWLREVGIERTTIGFFAWIGITYSIKVFWAPFVDRISIPGLTRRLGRRRSWMLLAQCGIVIGLLGMAHTNPIHSLGLMAVYGFLVAFSSATQDISIDAYRIEAIGIDYQGAMAAMYQAGYRIAAALVAQAAALFIADFFSWVVAYQVMAVCMTVGVVTVFVIQEPESSINRDTYLREARVITYLENSAHLPEYIRQPAAWFIGAVVCPFTDFFLRNGRFAIFLLIFIALYRISDVVLGNLANPFYVDMGFTLSEIASIAKIFGFFPALFGAFIGGVLVVRFGVLRILLLGAVLVAVANLSFAYLAYSGKSLIGLAAVIGLDNFSAGVAGSAFIAYLSSLTNSAYTATQYALFSSLMTLFPKLISGFSGMIVDATSYSFFFVYASLLGLPVVLMVMWMMRREWRLAQLTG
jgi:PAT family beta-lactamase induction signal transducer AmpG